ncbi:MAG TPA: hypothetical protein VFX92_11980 [Candidatus Krumholzibacteria bacterium]|nr:hypothetical protein [Candidatus Krumholzibacteria bacterium]
MLSSQAGAARLRFTDDFEKGLDRWEITGEGGAFVQESGDPVHRKVLVLRPQGDVLALVRGSDRWGSVAIEGDVRFPGPENSYLGVAYNCRRKGDRFDFGLIYIKGNGSYLLPNPHRDFNVSRLLYEEYRTPLEGDAAVRIDEWQRFKMEVVGREAHVYVGPGTTPQLTFPLFEFDSGELGLQPRSVGGDVWVDNVSVSSIDKFSYAGPARPMQFQYDPEALLTAWEVAGPMASTDDGLARDPDSYPDAWRRFETDGRGAVITGRVTDYHGPDAVAYFRARVVTDVSGSAVLNISTVDDLALWVNGRFQWFIPRSDHAWYDFWRNPAHDGQHIPVQLMSGSNDIIVRVRGGVYASGGFYAWLEKRR